MSKQGSEDEVWVVIPARGGSKGVPGKNIRPVNGLPLISYVIDVAKKVKNVTSVVVSTDDARISEIAVNHGAIVIDRPHELSGDTASSESALIHCLESLKDEKGYLPEVVVFMQCTSPLTIAEDVEGIIKLIAQEGADSAFTAVPFHGFLWAIDFDGSARAINHESEIRLRRQDRTAEYRETGAVYGFRPLKFLSAKHRFFGKTMMHVVSSDRSLDIDDLVDFKIAEVLLKSRDQ
jgi:CMP-N-acetylneuraminic acid synthetase